MKKYWKKNKEKLKPTNAIRNRIWYTKKNKEEYNAKKRVYENNRRRKDLQFAIKKRCRIRVWQKLKGIKKSHSDEYGIDYNKIAEHLISVLPFDYNENPGKYEIDHIKLLSSFDLTNLEEIKKAFAPGNHQWLTTDKHKEKHNGK